MTYSSYHARNEQESAEVVRKAGLDILTLMREVQGRRILEEIPAAPPQAKVKKTPVQDPTEPYQWNPDITVETDWAGVKRYRKASGKLHRYDGPAVDTGDHIRNEWYLDGHRYNTQDEWGHDVVVFMLASGLKPNRFMWHLYNAHRLELGQRQMPFWDDLRPLKAKTMLGAKPRNRLED